MATMALAFGPQQVFLPRITITNTIINSNKKKKKAHVRLFSYAMNTVNVNFLALRKPSLPNDGSGINEKDSAKDLLNRMLSLTSQRNLHLHDCKQIHNTILSSGLDQDVFLGSKLVAMYATCGSVGEARQVFDKMSETQNVVLWTAMISGYAKNRLYEETLRLYFGMKSQGICPDDFTFSSVLKACAGLAALEQGKDIHVHMIKRGCHSNGLLGSSLVGMYTKCGRMEDARQVFDRMSERNVVSWSSMISGFQQNRQPKEALEYFRRMFGNGVKPDSKTLSSVLMTCTHLAALKCGTEIHAHIMKSGMDSNAYVCCSLVAMYAECERLEAARRVFDIFDRISKRSVVLWNAMIGAYSKNGCANEALQLFSQMLYNGMKISPVTLANVLSACGDSVSLKQCKEIHCYVMRKNFGSSGSVSSALIDMYGRYGYADVACQVVLRKSERDVRSWTAMIAGYGVNGHGEEAIKCFRQMENAGLKPNDATFVGILSGCSHAGLVTEGWHYFNSISKKYHMKPKAEHYACIVDLLGRAGRLKDAQDIIQNMPVEPDAGVWRALLRACKIHSNVKLGERVARRLFEIDPENAGNYILLSNIYAAADRWNDVERVGKMLIDKGIQPQQERSWIEVKNEVHSFMVLSYLSLLQRKSVLEIISILLLRSFLKLLTVKVL